MMMNLYRKPNDWMLLSKVTKEFDTHRVTIYEYMDRNSVSRVLEPQSGNHIRAVCRYVVHTEQPVGNKVTKTREMSMSELYDAHPWFFAKVR